MVSSHVMCRTFRMRPTKTQPESCDTKQFIYLIFHSRTLLRLWFHCSSAVLALLLSTARSFFMDGDKNEFIAYCGLCYLKWAWARERSIPNADVVLSCQSRNHDTISLSFSSYAYGVSMCVWLSISAHSVIRIYRKLCFVHIKWLLC